MILSFSSFFSYHFLVKLDEVSTILALNARICHGFEEIGKSFKMNDQISSAGLELANVLVTSPPLHQSWDAVQKQKLQTAADPNSQMALYISETKHSSTIIVSFLTSPVTPHDQQVMVSSLALKDANFPLFEFLCSKNTPNFSVNELAINFFKLNLTNLDNLRKELVASSKSSRIVITGHSFGGAVATLFTLWLLQILDLSKAKRPLCITFGSPLIGDENLRQCVLEFSTWSSCFLNVASINDPVPKVFLTSQASGYKPFGTFLLCSSSGGSCFEDADAILQLLVETSSHCVQNPVPNSGTQLFDYGQILNDLKTKALSRDVFELVEEDRVPLKAGIKTQLAAILGVLSSQSLQQQQPNIEFESLIKKMVTHERKLAIQKTKVYSSFLKLNDIKKYMANMEWYKKESKDMGIGYYDRYRNKRYASDINAEEYKKKLFNYWLDTVTEAANKPQTEGAAMRVRFLFAGTNYRRMIEPLHIAEYYKEGGKNYLKERPRHFVLLEQWYNEEEEKKKDKRKREERENPQLRSASKSNSKAKSVASSLNDDSCFWVHVEEALILCDELASNPDATQKLIEFDRYVLDTLENFAVTPDIFLAQSSFMRWWNKYKETLGSRYSTELTDVMKRRTYRNYAKGVSVLADL
ncbi:senescence-associated carboxylesterase 101 [Pyrus ussuriensis x Pyrus communis]|uniref:Senescence-associated carboxylesterase 101 n=1 Tax=Pyrus ussuriensis x Pyrus communis TaxID=2448454 RepID=A0A5N5F876_9ROSA|nr:senescence-associated carboxylesterase 101 [Pyrus ussuriensis x Pyrus communis]